MDLNLKCIDAFKCIFRSEFCEYKNQFLNAYTLWILHTKYVHIIWHTWCDKTKVRQLVKLFNFPRKFPTTWALTKPLSSSHLLPHFFQVIIDPFAIALQFQDLICLCIKRGITCFWAINPPLHSALKTKKDNFQFGEKWSFTDDAQWRKTILFNHSIVLYITIFSHF